MLGKRSHAAFAMEASPSTASSASELMNQAPTNALREIPRFVQYTSAAPNSAPQDLAPRATTLPLNLIALIVSYLDDIGDIARVTRTSRLLYYMTLPQLYERVALHSYGDIRYVNGKPEGFGSGSPFMMALNGLVTKAHGSLVKHFRVWGEWKELGIDDFAKGRVPDNSMMLNILLRAAMDKMSKLESFCWELNCKPLKTLYQGLGAHNHLTTFTLRFPSTRVPRPSVLIPPMANLRVFKALDIDPMCYPDDISMLMLHSKKLVDVRLHFSPRMRQEAESIMNLNMFFGRCHKAGYKMKLSHFALQNFFGPNVLGMEQIFDVDYCHSVTFLDTFGGNDPRTIFVDDTWKNVPLDVFTKFKNVRCNEVAPQHLDIMRGAVAKMERFYIVNERRGKTGYTPPDAAAPSPLTPNGEAHMDSDAIALGPDYLYTLTRYHGESLKHILLSDHWWLSNDDVVDIVRYCPNLEQLGIAINTADHNIMRLMMPFLPKIQAIRVLHNEHLVQHLRTMSHEERMWQMGYELGQRPHQYLKLIGLGDNYYKPGKIVEVMREDGTVEMRREMSMVGKDEAMKFEIWRLDCLDINVDPIATWVP